MFILIFIVMLSISAIFFYLSSKDCEDDEYEILGFISFFVGAAFLTISILTAIYCYILLGDLCEIPIIEQKIIVY